MSKNILIIGDSFAADWSQVDTSYPGWPQLLSKKYTVTNLAQAGCGEYRILQQLKTQQDLDQYDWIIVCHTSPARVHTKQHPVHNNSPLHSNADLIFTDVEYHMLRDKKQKNRPLTSAYDYFVYHYDAEYNRDIYQLIVKEIYSIIGDRPTITVDNFGQLDQSKYKFYLDFTKITEISPGKVNHCSRQGNIDICHNILDIISDKQSILPDFLIKSLRLAELDYFAPDDPECTKLNDQYPHTVKYQFNSRGYRGAEWPDNLTDLKKSNWCVGDSATIGLGVPLAHAWPSVLEKHLNARSIQVAMSGASNNWISRKAQEILTTIQPSLLVIQWSFLNRRELDESQVREQRWQTHYQAIKDPSWPDCTLDNIDHLPIEIQQELKNDHYTFDHFVPDEERRLNYDITSTADDDINYTIERVKQVELVKNTTTVIHSFVPYFAFNNDVNLFYKQLETLSVKFIPEFNRLDLARDGEHYDIKTSEYFVKNVVALV